MDELRSTVGLFEMGNISIDWSQMSGIPRQIDHYTAHYPNHNDPDANWARRLLDGCNGFWKSCISFIARVSGINESHHSARLQALCPSIWQILLTIMTQSAVPAINCI